MQVQGFEIRRWTAPPQRHQTVRHHLADPKRIVRGTGQLVFPEERRAHDLDVRVVYAETERIPDVAAQQVETIWKQVLKPANQDRLYRFKG